MARKRPAPPGPTPPVAAPHGSLTAERIARLYRLLRLLRDAPQTRPRLMQRLRLDVRGFYRDLESLRAAGVPVLLEAGRYSLGEPFDAAAARLPFPDPQLTFGEARTLARGRTAVHRKLQKQLDDLLK